MRSSLVEVRVFGLMPSYLRVHVPIQYILRPNSVGFAVGRYYVRLYGYQDPAGTVLLARHPASFNAHPHILNALQGHGSKRHEIVSSLSNPHDAKRQNV